MDKHIVLTNQIKEIEKVQSTLNEYFWELSIGEYDRKKLFIAVDEILSNIIYYGFDDVQEHFITLQVMSGQDSIELIFTDDGKYFDPLDYLAHGKPLTPDEKTGGLGLNLISKLMNQLQYHRLDNKNIFRINLKFNSVPQ